VHRARIPCKGRPGRRGDCSPRLPQIRTCPIKASGSSSHGLAARSAIRWCFVDTGSGFCAPTLFPPSGSATRRPRPSAGFPRVGFPGLAGTMRRSDSLRTFSPRFVCASLGDTIPRRLCSLRSGPTTTTWGQGPSGTAVPRRRSMSRWSRRASQVPGEPWCAYAVFFDPGETDSARPLRRVGAAPVSRQVKGSRGYGSRGSIARPEHWLSTLRRRPCGTADARLASGCRPGSTGWDCLPTGLQ
jgi:hypothetical protein